MSYESLTLIVLLLCLAWALSRLRSAQKQLGRRHQTEAALFRRNASLTAACRNLIDDVNRRHPNKSKTEFVCPYMQRISDILEGKL